MSPATKERTGKIVRVDVSPLLLRWATDRANLDAERIAKIAPKFDEWLAGDTKPTFKQLEKFAIATFTPLGYLLLDSPPEEPLPVTDFRTFVGTAPSRPSPNLLDTIYACERRQEWYRTHALQEQFEPLPFVGSMNPDTNVIEAGAVIRRHLNFEVSERSEFASWTDAFRGLTERAEELGILVMVNGVVGSNTHRKLDPEEFRGFALVDNLAPIVFVNGADTQAAKIFTLVHEIAHIWLGAEGVTNATLDGVDGNEVERWCNRVAAEVLVPLDAVRNEAIDDDIAGALNRIAREFRVSTLVVLRRLRDAGRLSAARFHDAYAHELARVLALKGAQGGGGNFYNTLPVRVSKAFARALIVSTLEGRTLHRDAYSLLAIKRSRTFDELAARGGDI